MDIPQIPTKMAAFRSISRPISVSHRSGGSTTSPLLYPGNPAPPRTPALHLVLQGYTVVARQRNAEILCRGRTSSAARHVFPRFCLPTPVLAVFLRFGRSAAVFASYRPFGCRFRVVSEFRPPFLTFRPYERCFRGVLNVLKCILREWSARITFPRFGRFYRFRVVPAVRPPFFQRFGLPTTVSRVLAVMQCKLRVRGAPVTFPRFPPFRPFSPFLAVRLPFSRRIVRSAAVFPTFGLPTTVSHVSAIRSLFSWRIERFEVYPT